MENIAALGDYVVQNGMLTKLGPPFAFTLWVAARLLLVHGSTIENKLSPQLQFFVDALRAMGHYWQVAERYTMILQRVLDEHGDSERSAAASGEKVIPSSVRILADMRRCAYDLDILISRQPKHIGGVSRLPSVTPARTPASNELECRFFIPHPAILVALYFVDRPRRSWLPALSIRLTYVLVCRSRCF